MLKPNKIDLVQLSPEWHEYREKGIGSSDASIISGHLPEAWDSMFALSTYKITGSSRTFDEVGLARITRGQELEPVAREEYIRLTGNVVEPGCFIHPEFDFIRASLDGITEDFKIITEIKCSGDNVYNKVVEGEIPDYYYAQMQHQLACVPGSEKVDFVMFDPDKGTIIYEVFPDLEFISELLRREEVFWRNVLKKKKLYGGQLGKKIPINAKRNLIYPLEGASIEETPSTPESQTPPVESQEATNAESESGI